MESKRNVIPAFHLPETRDDNSIPLFAAITENNLDKVRDILPKIGKNFLSTTDIYGRNIFMVAAQKSPNKILWYLLRNFPEIYYSMRSQKCRLGLNSYEYMAYFCELRSLVTYFSELGTLQVSKPTDNHEIMRALKMAACRETNDNFKYLWRYDSQFADLMEPAINDTAQYHHPWMMDYAIGSHPTDQKVAGYLSTLLRNKNNALAEQCYSIHLSCIQNKDRPKKSKTEFADELSKTLTQNPINLECIRFWVTKHAHINAIAPLPTYLLPNAIVSAIQNAFNTQTHRDNLYSIFDEFFMIIKEHLVKEKLEFAIDKVILSSTKANDKRFIEHLINNKIIQIDRVKMTKNDFNQTPLMIAAEHGHIEMFRYLCSIHHNDYIEKNIFNGYSALDLAVINGRIGLIKFIYDKAGNVFSPHINGYIKETVRLGHLEVLKFFIENKIIETPEKWCDEQKSTMPMIAAKSDHANLLHYFVGLGLTIPKNIEFASSGKARTFMQELTKREEKFIYELNNFLLKPGLIYSTAKTNIDAMSAFNTSSKTPNENITNIVAHYEKLLTIDKTSLSTLKNRKKLKELIESLKEQLDDKSFIKNTTTTNSEEKHSQAMKALDGHHQAIKKYFKPVYDVAVKLNETAWFGHPPEKRINEAKQDNHHPIPSAPPPEAHHQVEPIKATTHQEPPLASPPPRNPEASNKAIAIEGEKEPLLHDEGLVYDDEIEYMAMNNQLEASKDASSTITEMLGHIALLIPGLTPQEKIKATMEVAQLSQQLLLASYPKPEQAAQEESKMHALPYFFKSQRQVESPIEGQPHLEPGAKQSG